MKTEKTGAATGEASGSEGVSSSVHGPRRNAEDDIERTWNQTGASTCKAEGGAGAGTGANGPMAMLSVDPGQSRIRVCAKGDKDAAKGIFENATQNRSQKTFEDDDEVYAKSETAAGRMTSGTDYEDKSAGRGTRPWLWAGTRTA